MRRALETADTAARQLAWAIDQALSPYRFWRWLRHSRVDLLTAAELFTRINPDAMRSPRSLLAYCGLVPSVDNYCRRLKDRLRRVVWIAIEKRRGPRFLTRWGITVDRAYRAMNDRGRFAKLAFGRLRFAEEFGLPVAPCWREGRLTTAEARDLAVSLLARAWVLRVAHGVMFEVTGVVPSTKCIRVGQVKIRTYPYLLKRTKGLAAGEVWKEFAEYRAFRLREYRREARTAD